MSMTQQQRKQKLNGKLTDLRVRVAFTSIKSLEREATKLASAFSVYAEELEREAEAQRIRADKAQNKLNNLKRLLEESFPDLDFLYNIIVTDYPEGSNTDAKRD